MLFIRHGQSEFNVHYGATGRDPGIEDPGLTPLGEAQIRGAAAALTATAGEDQAIDHIVSSPYLRALQTASILADMLGLAIRIEPLIREHHHFTCDIGRRRSILRRDWPHLDFEHLDEQWWTDHHEQEDEVQARVRAFLDGRAQEKIAGRVLHVSHWGFIRRMTGLAVDNGTIVRVAGDGTGKVVHMPDS